jgi:hypothetical protein
VILLGHVAGVPVEETLPMLGGAGGMMLLARAWLWMHLKRLSRSSEDQDSGVS